MAALFGEKKYILQSIFFYNMGCVSVARRSLIMRIFISLTFMLIAQSVKPNLAHAYIDPNTGGYLFQILFPVISMIAAIYLFFKNQIISLFLKIIGLLKKW